MTRENEVWIVTDHQNTIVGLVKNLESIFDLFIKRSIVVARQSVRIALPYSDAGTFTAMHHVDGNTVVERTWNLEKMSVIE